MADDRPNILILCTDQQRFDALGAAGNAAIQTPHLDRLAADGVLFEQCYVQNPICGPSRACLLTGRYAHSHGLWANGVALPSHNQLISQWLADGGYDCGLIGKLHLGPVVGGQTEPRHADGFRLFEWAHDPSHRSPANAYHAWLRERDPAAFAAAWAGPGNPQDQIGPPGHLTFDAMPAELHYTRWIGDRTRDFLTAGRDLDKPFCLFANFFDPHHPFIAPPAYRARYDAAALPAPTGSRADLRDRPAALTEAAAGSYAGFLRGYDDYSPAERREMVAEYYAMMTFIDDEIGAILATLTTAGLAENTLVIFTSDHGDMLGDHGLALKGSMLYEGAVRVPLLMHWPAGGVRGGHRVPELVQWIDLAPTMADTAGLPPLPGAQGTSLLPLARGESVPAWRDFALCEFRNSGVPHDPPVHSTMLRHGDDKLIIHHGHPATSREHGGELYDLRADPGERHNRWTDPAYAERRQRLERMLLDTLVATEDRTAPRLGRV